MQNDHDLLIEINQIVKNMDKKLEDHLREYSEHKRDGETRYSLLSERVTKLENFRWWFLGVAAAVGVIFNLLKDWIMKNVVD